MEGHPTLIKGLGGFLVAQVYLEVYICGTEQTAFS
jgi:hypothetical protein